MSATRCPYCTTRLSPRSAAFLVGLVMGASVMALVIFTTISHFTPQMTALSALDSCEERLERYAGVSAVADAIDRAQAHNNSQGGR